jgi:hypothetical protein
LENSKNWKKPKIGKNQKLEKTKNWKKPKIGKNQKLEIGPGADWGKAPSWCPPNLHSTVCYCAAQ